MRRGRTPSDQPRSPEQLLRTPSGSMLRTKSGRRLVTDERRWLLLLLPAVALLYLALDWALLPSAPLAAPGPAAGAGGRRLASAVLAPALPPSQRTALHASPHTYGGVSHPRTVVREAPAVILLDDVVSAEERAHIIATARPLMKDAVVSGDGAGFVSKGRSNAVAWVAHDTSPTIWAVVQRLCGLAGVQSSRAESMQVIRYAVGQKYNAHFDAYDKTSTRGQVGLTLQLTSSCVIIHL